MGSGLRLLILLVGLVGLGSGWVAAQPVPHPLDPRGRDPLQDVTAPLPALPFRSGTLPAVGKPSAGTPVDLAWPGVASTSTALAPVLSAALPGTGQFLLGQRRGWTYAGVELLGWALFMNRRGAGGALKDQYRDLAWEVARGRVEPRVDGAFAFYETMEKWTRSGAFDADAGSPGIQPEREPTTFNGSIWSRATRLFSAPDDPSDPRYQAALSYYTEHAFGAAYLWDWTGAEDDLARYTQLIGRSDDRYRQATTVLGFLIANHVLSAADALLATRSGRAAAVRVAPDRAHGGVALVLRFGGSS